MSACSLPYERALVMVQRYCAYQDRCTSQVVSWCRQKGVSDNDAQRLVSALYREGYLDDERYARAFARGKFRNNQWGRNKIRAALRACGLSNDLVAVALSEIDESDYREQLKVLLLRKTGSPVNKLSYHEQMRVASWAAAKGYEHPLIMETLKLAVKETENECE